MRKITLLFATGFGVGYFPKMPGTFGSLLGLILLLKFPDNLFLIIGLSVLGIIVAQKAEKILKKKDSSEIVIDEVVGMLIAGYGLTGSNLLLAFVIFRVLDIVKPEPIRSLQKLPGGLGVMIDDLVAGILTNAAIMLANALLLEAIFK